MKPVLFVESTIFALLILWATAEGAPRSSASAPSRAPEKADARAVITAFESWWYRGAPFPDDTTLQSLKDELDRGSTDPKACFWVSRAILRSASGKPTPSEEKEVWRLTEAAAAGGLDIAVVELARRDLKRTTAPEARDAALSRLYGALERDDSSAAILLGQLYLTGTVLRRNCTMAAKCFKLALTLGDVKGHFNLGLAQRELGEYDAALASMRAGAEAGSASAQFMLGSWLSQGSVSRVDLIEAEKWFRSAAEKGDPDATIELAGILANDESRPDAHAEALRLLTEVAPKNDNAKYELAQVYLYGTLGAGVDIKKAERMLRELADTGHREASYELGLALVTGWWLPQNQEAGMQYLRSAAAKGVNEAALAVRLYEHLRETSTKRDAVRRQSR